MPARLTSPVDLSTRIAAPDFSACVLACLLFGSTAGAAQAQDAPVPIPRVAVEDDDSGSAIRLLEEAGPLPMPIAVRLVLPGAVLDDERDARLARFEQRGTPVWLSVPAPFTEGELEAWRGGIRRLIDRPRSTLRVLEVAVDGQPAGVAAFAIQVAATEVRAQKRDVRVAIGGEAMHDPARRGGIYAAELAPYIDLLALDEDRAAGAAEWLERTDRAASIVMWSTGPVPGAQDPARVLVDGVIGDLGTLVVTRAWRAAGVTAAALQALASLSTTIGDDISVLDPEAVDLTLTVAAQDVSALLPYRLLFDTNTFSTLLVYGGTAAEEPLTVSLRVPIEGTPGIHDPLTGATSLAERYTRDDATGRTTAAVPLTGRPMVVNFNEGGTVLAERMSVTAERRLTVAEIVSRHQAQQLSQDRLVRHYIADARTRQFFRPTFTDPGYDIVTENRYFVAGDGIEWEELSFSVNNRRFENRTPLPMLQPEKVFSLPLQLRFDEGYRYELLGTERVDGFDCYRLRFEPVRDDPSLYRGTVWIDRRTFARIRVQAVQGGLSGMVVSNEETLRYVPVVTIGNQPVFLLDSVTGRQIVLLAGRNILLEKSVAFSGFQVNGEGFTEARTTARRSDRIMYRETPDGLRHFIERDGERVVSDRPTESVKAMAMGLVLDPSYAFPLPIVGINYIDFAFGNPDTQLALLFAGVLAAGNIQRPQLGSSRLDASLDFFAIAAPSSDRVYLAAGETESERVLTWPMSAGLNLGWQATPFQKLTLQYQFRFDAYVRDSTTSETFQPPSSTVTNAIGGAWEHSRGGYTVVINGARFLRSHWKPWGEPGLDGVLDATPRSYTKYSASVSRDFLLSLFHKVNVNATWFGGRDLDRFVKYQFGMFDATRIHGVPGTVRFGELAVVRGSYSINVFNQYRLDLFIDHGWGRDADDEPGWRSIPGVGAAFNLPAPWNTMLRADVGRSWLPARYESLGSTTLQIMLLKPL